MGYWNETVANIRNWLNDWLVYNSIGNNTPNLDLVLINRATQFLCQYRPWSYFTKNTLLSLNSSRQAVVPSDIMWILRVFEDVNSDGIPDRDYFLDDSRQEKSYSLLDNWTVSAGHSWIMQFATSPTNPVYIRHTVVPAPYTGVDIGGNDITEYSFFPPNLVFRIAQKLFAEDKGLTGDQVNLVLQAANIELKHFETAHQEANSSGDFIVKDGNGYPIKLTVPSLSGRRSMSSDSMSTYPRSSFFVG